MGVDLVKNSIKLMQKERHVLVSILEKDDRGIRC